MPHCLLISKVNSPAVTQDNCLFSQIRASICGDNAMLMAPYVQPLHMKVSKHLEYILKASCDPLWVVLMPHCLLLGKVYRPAVTQDNCPFSQIWSSTCSDNAMMMAPYVQPLHMKVGKHLEYIL